MTDNADTADRSGFQVTRSAAHDYDRYLQPIMGPIVDALIAKAQIRPGSAVLDLACGTGFCARAALVVVGVDGRVDGLDINESMLAIARDSATGSATQVTWHQGSAGDLPFDADTFDVVLCQQGAQFFPDVDAASGEIARVLRPTGQLLATVWAELSASPYLQAQYDAIRAVIGAEATASFAAAFGSSERIAAALEAAGLNVVVEGLTVTAVLPELVSFAPGHLRAIPWGAAVAAVPGGIEAVTASMSAALSHYTRPDGSIAAPFRSAVICATHHPVRAVTNCAAQP